MGLLFPQNDLFVDADGTAHRLSCGTEKEKQKAKNLKTAGK
jgi:hypothetical protein